MMKRRATGGLLATIFVCLVGCHGNSLKTEGLIEDLDYYVRSIHESHGEPFRMISEADFEKNAEDEVHRLLRAKRRLVFVCWRG